MIMVVTVSILK